MNIVKKVIRKVQQKINPYYEVCEDGTEICWIFECICENKGKCATCKINLAYDKFCESEV